MAINSTVPFKIARTIGNVPGHEEIKLRYRGTQNILLLHIIQFLLKAFTNSIREVSWVKVPNCDAMIAITMECIRLAESGLGSGETSSCAVAAAAVVAVVVAAAARSSTLLFELKYAVVSRFSGCRALHQ
jgi:hypothetical protein